MTKSILNEEFLMTAKNAMENNPSRFIPSAFSIVSLEIVSQKLFFMSKFAENKSEAISLLDMAHLCSFLSNDTSAIQSIEQEKNLRISLSDSMQKTALYDWPGIETQLKWGLFES